MKNRTSAQRFTSWLTALVLVFQISPIPFLEGTLSSPSTSPSSSRSFEDDDFMNGGVAYSEDGDVFGEESRPRTTFGDEQFMNGEYSYSQSDEQFMNVGDGDGEHGGNSVLRDGDGIWKTSPLFVEVAEAQSGPSIPDPPTVSLTSERDMYPIGETGGFSIVFDENFDSSKHTVRAFWPEMGEEVTSDLAPFTVFQGETYTAYTPTLDEAGPHQLTILILANSRLLARESYVIDVLDSELEFVDPEDGDTVFSEYGSGEISSALTFTNETSETLADFNLTIELDGTDITSSFLINSWSALATLSSLTTGEYTLDAYLYDSTDGYEYTSASSTFTHIADTDAPVITLHNISDGDYFSEPSLTILGSIEEDYPDTFTLNSTEYPFTNDFAIPYTLDEGANVLTFTATDKATWETSETLTVYGDFTAPETEITSHDDGEVVSCSGVSFEGTTDDSSATHTITVRNPWNEDHQSENDGAGYISEYASPTVSSTGGSTETVSETIDLVAGQNIIELLAEDSAENRDLSTVFLYCDEEGPSIQIRSPQDGESIYAESGTSTATIQIEYDDFLSEIDSSSVTLTVTDSVGTDVTASLTDDTSVWVEGDGSDPANEAEDDGIILDGGVSGTLSGFDEEETYTLTVTVEDDKGNSSSESTTFYVAPSDITPPEEGEDDGMIHGRVVDSSTCDEYGLNCDGLPGVEVTVSTAGEVSGDGELTSEGSDLDGTAISGPDGHFSFPTPDSDTYWLLAHTDGYTYGQREVNSIKQKNAYAGTIHLTPLVEATLFNDLDSDGEYDAGEEISEIDETGGMATASGTQADGTSWEMTLEIPSGAIDSGDSLAEMNLTWFENVEYLPSGELPEGTAETFAMDISGDDPTEEIEFNSEVTVTFSDTRGFPSTFPDTGETLQIPVGYWNSETLEWEHVGQATAIDSDSDGNADEFQFQTDHLSPYDCNMPVSDANGDKTDSNESSQGNRNCDGDDASCFIPYHSGDLYLDYALPDENFLGETVGLSLTYSSQTAHPTALIASSTTLDDEAVGEFLDLQWAFSIAGETIERIYTEAPDNDTYQFQYLFDGTDADGLPLATGLYSLVVDIDAAYEGEYYFSEGGVFGADPDIEEGATGVSIETVYEGGFTDTLALHNLSESSLGSGWTLDGMQTLYESEDGYLMITDGQQTDRFYFAGKNAVVGSDSDSEDIVDNPIIGISGMARQLVYFLTNNEAVGISDVDISVGYGPIKLLMSADGAYVYSLNRDQSSVSVLDLETYDRVDINGDGDLDDDDDIEVGVGPNDFSLSPDGTTLYVANRLRDTVSVVDLTTYERMDLDGDGDTDSDDDIAVGAYPNTLLISDDGLYVYTVNYSDNTVSQIEVASHTVVATMDVGSGPFSVTESTTTGYLYVNNYVDGTVSVLDPSTQTRVDLNLDGSSDSSDDIEVGTSPNRLLFNADETLLYVSHYGDHTVGIFDTSTHERLDVNGDGASDSSDDIDVGEGPRDLLLNADETVLYTANYDGDSVSAVDLTTYARMDLDGDGDTDSDDDIEAGNAAYMLALDSTESYLYVPNYGADSLTVIEVSSHTNLIDFPVGEDPIHVMMEPSTDLPFVANSTSDTISIVDIESDTTVSEVELGTTHGGVDLIVNSDGTRLYTANRSEDTVSVVDLENGEVVDVDEDGDRDGDDVIDVGDEPYALAITPDDAYVYVANEADDTVSVIDTSTLTRVDTNGDGSVNDDDDLSVGQAPEKIAITPDGAYVYTVNTDDGSVSVIEVASQSHLLDISTDDGAFDLAITPDSAYVYVANFNPNTSKDSVSVIEVSSQTKVTDIEVPNSPRDIAITPDGTYAIVANYNGYGVSILDIESQTNIRDVVWGYYPYSVVVSPDSRYAYVAQQYDNVVTIIDIAEEDVVGEISVNGYPYDLDITPDGETLYVTLRSDDIVAVIDVDQEAVVSLIRLEDAYALDIQDADYPVEPSYTIQNLNDDDYSTIEYHASSGSYSRAYPDGTTVTFNEDGTHDTTEDRLGNQIHYEYNADGTVSAVEYFAAGESDPALSWEFSYTDSKLTQITSPSGAATQFTINDDGDLTAIENADGGVRTYTYDDRHLALTKTLESGETTSYRYDDYGKIEATLSPPRDVIDSDGTITENVQELRQYEPADTQSLVNDEDDPIVGTPDSPAALTVKADIVGSETDASGETRLRAFNKFGSTEQTTDALSRVVQYDRDESNNVVQQILGGDYCVYTVYDEDGYVLSESLLEEPLDLSETDEDDYSTADELTVTALTTLYTYEDRYHQVQTETGPNDNTTTYVYDYEFDTDEDGDFDSDDDAYGDSINSQMTYAEAYASQGDQFVGNLWRVEYPEVEVYDPDAHSISTETPTQTFTYNAYGQLLTEKDENGTITAYGYTQADGNSYLTSITQDYTEDGTSGLNLTTTFSDYDSFGNHHRVTHPNGEVTDYEYDGERGLMTAMIETVDLDQDGTQETLRSEYDYDDRDNLIQEVRDADGSQTVTIDFTYNAHDQLTKMVTTDSTTGETVTVQNYFDDDRNLLVEVNGNGHKIHYTYDEENQLTRQHFTDSFYDPIGLYYETYTYDDNGDVETVTLPSGAVTQYVYDDYGRVTQEIANVVSGGTADDENFTTTYEYDDEGNLLYETGPNGVVTAHTYDALNRLKTLTLDYTEDGTSGENLTFTYDYDAAGNLLLETDERGVQTQMTYDALHRLEQMTDDYTADGTSGKNLTQTFTYDERGNLETLTDQKGTVTRYTYDELSRPLTITQDYTPDGTTGENLTTAYRYDRLGHQTDLIDPNGHTHTTTYNGFSLATETVVDEGGEALTTTYAYDSNYNLIEITDDNDNTTTFVYDALDRQTQVLYADGSTEEFDYDLQGTLGAETSANGDTISYDYDALNRLTTVTFESGETQTFTYDEAGRLEMLSDSESGSSVTHAYNDLDDLTSSTQALGSLSDTVSYDYDYEAGAFTVNYPNGASITKSLDALGRLSTVENAAGTVLVENTYDEAANTWERTFDNGVTVEFSHDDVGRMTTIDSSLATYTYEYDDNSQVVSLERDYRTSTPYEAYEYDGAERLTGVYYQADSGDYDSVSAYDSHVTYTLDALGNRLEVEVDGTTTEYGPNDGSALTHEGNAYESVGGVTASYDTAGNLLDDGTHTYTYNEFNRLTSLTDGDGVTTTYTYDPVGRRIQKSVDGDVTRYLYDGLQAIEEQDSSGALQSEFVYGLWMDEPLQWTDYRSGSGGTVYTYHLDALGSVTELSDSSGALVEAYEYDAYGEATIYSDSARTTAIDYAISVGNPYLFTARRYDAESGHYYYRERYYRADWGRFLNPDPLGLLDGLNRYQYVGSNPVNGVDPLGLFLFRGEWINDVDRFLAGFGDTITFGGTTWFREKVYGTKATRNHSGTLFHTGQGVGIGVSLYLGYGAAGNTARAAGWSKAMAQTYTVTGNGYGAARSTHKLLTSTDCDPFGWGDALGFLPTAGAAGRLNTSGVRNGLSRAMNGPWRSFGNTFNLLSPGSKSRYGFKNLFYDNRKFRNVSSQYWKGGANGNSLQHVFFQNQSKWIPQGIRNSGFNLVEMPLDLNRWAGGNATRELALRLGVTTMLGVGAGTGGAIGNSLTGGGNSGDCPC